MPASAAARQTPFQRQSDWLAERDKHPFTTAVRQLAKMSVSKMQERPASEEGQLSVCPYCDSTIVEGDAHDCAEMGDNPTLSVDIPPKSIQGTGDLKRAPLAESTKATGQPIPAAVAVVPGAVAITSDRFAGRSASAAGMPVLSGAALPTTSHGGAADEIHGLIIDGRYEVLEKASQGGMGTVYKARHATLRNLLAVKILRKPKDEVSRRRFLQEAQLLSQIKHPNIVQVIDFGELPDGKSYLAMEFLSGPTVSAAVRDGNMTPLRACRIAAQIARGMHHVHEQGIVHRGPV